MNYMIAKMCRLYIYGVRTTIRTFIHSNRLELGIQSIYL